MSVYIDKLSWKYENSVFIEFLDPKNMGMDIKFNICSEIINIQKKMTKSVN